MHLLDSGYDWDYPGRTAGARQQFMRHARAKVLGGCSSHNSCIAFWPPAECLDEWVEMGATGWSAAEVLPLVERLETNDARVITAATARSGCATSRRTTPAARRCWRRRRWSGCRRWRSTAARRCATAPGWFQINAGEDGTRMSTSHAYLHPILDTRKNLEVRTGLLGVARSCSTSPMRPPACGTSGPT